MSYFQLQVITLGELGSASSNSLPGRYEDSADALAAAIDYGQDLAGLVLDGHRRPAVTIEFNETLGATVKVGNADDDGQYHLIYAIELGREVNLLTHTGRGFIVCKL